MPHQCSVLIQQRRIYSSIVLSGRRAQAKEAGSRSYSQHTRLFLTALRPCLPKDSRTVNLQAGDVPKIEEHQKMKHIPTQNWVGKWVLITGGGKRVGADIARYMAAH